MKQRNYNLHWNYKMRLCVTKRRLEWPYYETKEYEVALVSILVNLINAMNGAWGLVKGSQCPKLPSSNTDRSDFSFPLSFNFFQFYFIIYIFFNFCSFPIVVFLFIWELWKECTWFDAIRVSDVWLFLRNHWSYVHVPSF